MPTVMPQRTLDYARPSTSDDPVISARIPIAKVITIGTGVVLMLWLAGMVVMGDDLVVISLLPLRHLGISYPPILKEVSVIAPPVCAAWWLGLAFCVRRWQWQWRWRAVFSILSAVFALYLCAEAIDSVGRYARSRTTRVPVTRQLTPEEQRSLESRTSFPIFQKRDWRGTDIWIANREDWTEQLKQELRNQNLLRLPD
jgi:hypothetical protein